MNGELPQDYKDLASRFSVVDVFLKHQYPRHMNIKDVNNYLLLSDIHMDFLERHAGNIMFLYSYKEDASTPPSAYHLGRIAPHSIYDLSFLTLQYPKGPTPPPTAKISRFPSSTRNLRAVFECMGPKGSDSSKQTVDSRLRRLNSNMKLYVDDQYRAYLKRTSTKPSTSGRVAAFTMEELGVIPKASIPPPIAFSLPGISELIQSTKQASKDPVSRWEERD